MVESDGENPSQLFGTVITTARSLAFNPIIAYRIFGAARKDVTIGRISEFGTATLKMLSEKQL